MEVVIKMNIDYIKDKLSAIELLIDEIRNEMITNEYKIGYYLCTENLYMNTGECAYLKGNKYKCIYVTEFDLDIIDEDERHHNIPFDHEWINKFIYIENENM